MTEGDDVTVYPVIVEPLLLPAVYGTETEELFTRVTVPITGAEGAASTLLVITPLLPPTATKVPSPYVMLCQAAAEAAVPRVQSIPFWLVITLPSLETATKSPFANTTEVQKFWGT